jgi:hypothetical protein
MERPTKIPKDILPYVEEIEGKLYVYENSPIVESYVTIYNQVRSFNKQLQLGKEETTISEDGIEVFVQSGFVDLFADKEDKSFDRTKWYFENILDLNKTLDELRKLMTPEQQKEANEKVKHDNLGIAEKIALNSKNGGK